MSASDKHNAIEFQGLTNNEVLNNREQYGSNVITPAKKESVLLQFLNKFKDPLIIILIVAGLFSIAISFYEYLALKQPATVFFEPSGIFMAVLLATGLSFIFEHQAEKEFAILNRVNDDEPVQVIRNNGNVTSVPRRDVVMNDIVILNTGDEVPADGELLQATRLTVDESTLTGEPSCNKTTDPTLFDTEATFPSNHVMRGTKVMEGHGIMLVNAIGDATENGKVFKSVQIDNSVRTPLNEQLDRLGRLITRVSYTIAILIIAARITLYFTHGNGFEWMGFMTYFLQTIMIAVALVAVSIPEGLPMAVTLSLAYSMRRMLKTNNLVRKMHACETMGAVTVICTDKTGTLTQNQMQVNDAVFFGISDKSLINQAIAVNSTAQLDLSDPSHPKALGNPTEGALLLWLNSNGVDYQHLRHTADIEQELPFTTENKYMATLVREPDGKRVLFVKGAPEIILKMCGDMPDGVTRQQIQDTLLNYQNQAMRTLAFAYAILPDKSPTPIIEGRLVRNDLQLMGIVAIADPIRKEVPDAIRDCIAAAIRVTIITGDTIATARQIAREIGLWTDNDTDAAITTGPELSAMTDEELNARAKDIKIIARARPMDKKRFVETLEHLGDVVAATGDGTNDAPALKAAHVGLSMGDGTSVAKEASDITIVDNSFASIRRAVMWGRSLYKNIQRFVLFQMTVNVAACLVVMCGAFMGVESPLSVTQMLWVNLIMDTFAAMALASLPADPSVMDEKPRSRSAFIIAPPMWRFIIGTGVGFFAVLILILLYFNHYNTVSLHMVGEAMTGYINDMTTYERSLFFTIFVFLQFWNLFNARAFGSVRSPFNLRGCKGFVMIIFIILIGQIAIVSIGGRFFNVCPLNFTDWAIIIIATSTVAIIGEITHLLSSKKIKSAYADC